MDRLSTGIPGEIVGIDSPNRLQIRLPPANGDAELTFVVEPAPGGAVVRAIVTPIDAATEELVGALRDLLDVRLRIALRPRTPILTGLTPSDAPSLESQVVEVWPALRSVPRRRSPRISLAARLIGVAAVGAVLAAITWGSPSIPWAAAPEESTLGDEPVAAGRATPDPARVAPADAASAEPTGVALSTPPIPLTSPAVPPLHASLTVSDRLPVIGGYTVTVSITNSSGIEQSWQNVSVHLGGLNLHVTLVGSAVRLDLRGTDVCAAALSSATIAAGQTLTFSFKVTGLNLVEPTAAVLNQPICG